MPKQYIFLLGGGVISAANWASMEFAVLSPDIKTTSIARDRSRSRDVTARRKQDATRDRSIHIAITDRRKFLEEKAKAARSRGKKAGILTI